ncbi:MAG: aldo/keto reductase [Oscillospiraceae bacterium]|nr:aldo/keto reductase [Oscillospiraceae bacterium]
MERYLGEKTPKLGFGLMRLPRDKDDSSKADIEQIKAMVDKFIGAGFTYFDTAFAYGDSEVITREALVERYPRESYTLASKMNVWKGPLPEDAKAQFKKSLENTGAGYFDYYLLHSLQEGNYEKYGEFGLWDYVKELKAEGLVKNWGFSFHSGPELLDKLLTEHPDVDFIQLQVNYTDMDDPDVMSGANIEVAKKHNVPFVIMEPVKGGMLANPHESVRKIFEEYDPNASCASWAIRFAASIDGVITVLSGMSTLEQVEDNVSFMKDFKPLSEAEQEVIKKAQKAMSAIETIKCTNCRYCVDGCPMEIKIPDVFKLMNRYLMYNDLERAKNQYKRDELNASACIECGQCESVCPQSLNIIQYLKRSAEVLEE